MRNSLRKSGVPKPSSVRQKSRTDRAAPPRARSPAKRRDGQRPVRKVSRSRSRSPGLKRSNMLSPGRRDKNRSASRDRPRGSRSGGGNEMGLIARAREEMRLAMEKQQLENPHSSSRPSFGSWGRAHEQDVRDRDRDRGQLRMSLQERMGGNLVHDFLYLIESI
jgi:hypothetical protein